MNVQLMVALGGILLIALAVLLDSGPPAEPQRPNRIRSRRN